MMDTAEDLVRLMSGLLTLELIASRLWDFLIAPDDLGIRAACPALAHAACATVDDSRLRLPHLALLRGSEDSAMIRWARCRLCPEALESLRVIAGKVSGIAEAADAGEASRSFVSTFGGGAIYPDSELQIQAVRSLISILMHFVRDGAASWVDFVLSLELVDCVPALDDCGDMFCCVWRPTTCNHNDFTLRSWPVPVCSSALRIAASAGHTLMVQVLLSAGADISAVDGNESTALHWAADKGHAQVCDALLKGRAQVDAVDDDSWTPLCLAAEEGHCEACSALLSFNAEINLSDEDSRSPLWWATWKHHDRLVDLLLEARADVEQSDRDGVTPKRLMSVRCHAKS
eukprot:TRINITY_DN102900_c0_g1_i1.p1 TRINITY_DN102900_c0_g1~~TRINITY_DN102900_c0_g1_i1.p1  ORF type:complete len:345 (-),score=49.27 TRINITY_DN102900_c0_g1_i1:462-1496(-)